jgi:hypothetical protein
VDASRCMHTLVPLASAVTAMFCDALPASVTQPDDGGGCDGGCGSEAHPTSATSSAIPFMRASVAPASRAHKHDHIGSHTPATACEP